MGRVRHTESQAQAIKRLERDVRKLKARAKQVPPQVELLGEHTIDSPTTTLVVSGLDTSDYATLWAMWRTRTSNNTAHGGMRLRFNADTGNNYFYAGTRVEGTGTVTGIGNVGTTGFLVPVVNTTSFGQLWVADPANALMGTGFRTVQYQAFGRHGTTQAAIRHVTAGGFWGSSDDAIWEVRLVLTSGGNLAEGAWLRVYGIR